MFLVYVSNKIIFVSIQEITDRKIPILNKAFGNTFRIYNQSGLQIQIMRMYTYFKPMVDIFKCVYITINYVTAQGHVP